MDKYDILNNFNGLRAKIGFAEADSWYPIDEHSIKIKLKTGPVIIFSLYGTGEWRVESVRCNKKWGLN